MRSRGKRRARDSRPIRGAPIVESSEIPRRIIRVTFLFIDGSWEVGRRREDRARSSDLAFSQRNLIFVAIIRRRREVIEVIRGCAYSISRNANSTRHHRVDASDRGSSPRRSSRPASVDLPRASSSRYPVAHRLYNAARLPTAACTVVCDTGARAPTKRTSGMTRVPRWLCALVVVPYCFNSAERRLPVRRRVVQRGDVGDRRGNGRKGSGGGGGGKRTAGTTVELSILEPRSHSPVDRPGKLPGWMSSRCSNAHRDEFAQAGRRPLRIRDS